MPAPNSNIDAGSGTAMAEVNPVMLNVEGEPLKFNNIGYAVVLAASVGEKFPNSNAVTFEA